MQLATLSNTAITTWYSHSLSRPAWAAFQFDYHLWHNLEHASRGNALQFPYAHGIGFTHHLTAHSHTRDPKSQYWSISITRTTLALSCCTPLSAHCQALQRNTPQHSPSTRSKSQTHKPWPTHLIHKWIRHSLEITRFALRFGNRLQR